MKPQSLVLAVLLWGMAFSASAAEISADSDIVSVVVFPDRALVTRAARLSLDEGQQSVQFLSLPTNIDRDSFQIKGEGVAGVQLISTEVKKNVLERPRAEQIERLEAEIQDVRDQIALTVARSEDLKAEDDLVHAIGVYTGEQFSKEFITCEPQPEEWAAMVEFQRSNLARISEDILKTGIEKRELNRRLDALLRELNEVQGQAARENLDVTVFLSASKPGDFKLLLSYVIFGTNWYPSYDARADAQNQQVQFTGIGNVRQNTGEDWKNVALSLSTARPAIGAKSPELPPWYITPRPPMLPEAEGIVSDFERAAPLKLEKDYRGAPAEVMAATIIPLETSVQFAVPYKMDIPSDNAYHKGAIFTDKLKADFSYTSTPKLSPYAYLLAKVVNTTGAFWLPGRTTVFVDQNMIGDIPIETVAPNEEISLDFGIDEGITVEREELERKEDESHLFGKRKEKIFKDKITIANHKAKPIKLELIDQIPVSQHGEIKVTDVKFSVAPAERNPDTGIVKWNLELAPNEKKEITIQFAVVYPLEMEVSGL